MRRQIAIGVLSLCAACLEPAPAGPQPIARPRILAVIAEPAEAAPGAKVRYRAVFALPDAEPAPTPRWSFCVSPRPLRENGAVSEACARDVELGPVLEGELIEAALPRDACARFGPETSSGLRPSDPDATGGYYQPLRLTLDGAITVFRHRIRCALPDAPLARVQEFEARYRENRHPALLGLTLRAAGATLEARALPPAASIELELELEPNARERYARFDRRSGRVVDTRERLSVSWYASAGRLAHEYATFEALNAVNGWLSPEQSQHVWLWIVVRDDRGGVAAQAFELQVAID